VNNPSDRPLAIALSVTPGFDAGVHEIVRLFFPRCRIIGDLPGDLKLEVKVEKTAHDLKVSIELGGLLQAVTRERISSDHDQIDIKRQIIRLVYSLLRETTAENPSPYGILTGVRPVKLVHRYLDRGWTVSGIRRELEDKFLVSPEKSLLLTEVASRNRPYLLSPGEARKRIGVYIGIPYCPSRCHYCSFPGYPLDHRPGLPEFFNGLLYELTRLGEAMAGLGRMVDMIYIGGGTPTVLSREQWDKLLDALHHLFLKSDDVEFTVEAGRPDTLVPEILQRLAAAGVNRICVNPQTMNQATLDRIGRNHTVGMIADAMELVRKIGFAHVNMDLIIGLPGEGPSDVSRSLDEVLRLRPEGITLHHLAHKRGSIWQMQGDAPDWSQVRLSGNWWELLAASGYLPYYLYRQKMAGNQENIGFALPGTFSRYNIRVIEERETIIGFGGGAASKFVNPDDWTLTTLHHPKDPATYLSSLERLVKARVDKLQALS